MFFFYYRSMRLIIVTCAWLALVDADAGGGFRPGGDCHLCFAPYKKLVVPPHADLPQCKSAYLRPVNSGEYVSSNSAGQQSVALQASERILKEGREAASREEGQIFEEATWNENVFPSISPILFCVFFFVLVSVFCTSLIMISYAVPAQIGGIPEPVEVPLQDRSQHDILHEAVLVDVESKETPVRVKDIMKSNMEPEEVHSAENASSGYGIEKEVRSSRKAVTVLIDPVSVKLQTHLAADVQLDSESYVREFHSDSDTDDEEEPRMSVPEWSKTPNLTVALGKQLAQEINHDEVFKGAGRLKKKPSLGSFLISARLPRCSTDWACSPVPLGTYKPAGPATEEIAGENEENVDQMVPVTGSTTGSATGSTDEKRQKPYQLVQRGESWETAEGKQTDRPEQQQQQQQEVRSRCVTPEEVSDEAAIVQVEAIHGVFVKKGSCPFYLLKDRRYADPLETQWNAACELPDSAATAVNRFRVCHGKYKLRKWPCTLNEGGRFVRKACQAGVWMNEMDLLKKEACPCRKQRTYGKRH